MEKYNNKKIIAVVGMAGAGKSEVTNYLLEKLSCPKVYFGEVTFDRMKEEGIELNYENERITREKIRAEHGMGAYAKLSMPKIKKFLETSDLVVLESFYSWDEYKITRKEFGNSFMVVAAHASPKVRLSRLKNREHRPIENSENLYQRDKTEIEGTDKGGPIAMADFMLINEGTLEELHKKVDETVLNNLY
ncbi:MAG: AAA family ATPase [Patescibacteria group bacterium]|jgi:dephospho-CoA kinase|nr:AAA family ATPase [Patescibacteria group bacterium]